MKRKLMILATLAMIAFNFSSCVVHEHSYSSRGGRDYGYNRMRGHGHHHHHHAPRPGVTVRAY